MSGRRRRCGGPTFPEQDLSNPSDQPHLQAVVRGRVQGVGFRWAVVTLARDLGISGRVANQEDGTVLVMAEGSRGNLEALADWLTRGPRYSIVTEVETQWSVSQNRWTDFAIDHH